jgi:hypothetical protein
MEAKEKAIELVNKFYSRVDEERLLVNKYWSNAKFCALIAVDEIQEFMIDSDDFNIYWVNYWREVKNEIEKL